MRHLATVIVLTPDRAIEAQLGVFARETDADMRRKKEIRAEDLTIESLVAEGFPNASIERVGSQKIGFDIRAHRVIDDQTGQIEVRRIEVKGYTKGTPIQLTVNEWYSLSHYGYGSVPKTGSIWLTNLITTDDILVGMTI